MEKNKVAVIGAGLMGNGIAQACATAGYDVVNIDTFEAAIEKSKATVEKLFSRKAVPEKIEIKKDTFKKVDELADAETIIVSNTSGLSISEIASVTNRPDKVMGAHFFYPAPVMKLLELVRGLVTSDETYDVVKEFAGKIGKTTVDAPEFPGFMVNRILVPMQNEAAFMVMEGSKPEDVDNAMKLGCNHPMGPIELTDFVGIDTMLATMTGLYNGFHDSKYRPCPLLETMVKSGMLGKKTGQGFYKYDEKGNKIGSNF